MAEAPSGDGTADTANMADLALNLADQLINAFQQGAHGGEEEDGEGGPAQDDGTSPSDNVGAVDLDTDARDGNDEWQDLPRDDDVDDDDDDDDNELTESCCDNGVKEEGVGEENPESCFSPLGSHASVTEAAMMEQEHSHYHHHHRHHRDDDCDDDDENDDDDDRDVVFSPCRTLNFDDSDDGDDLPAVDQRFVQRGAFVQMDSMDDRPELHGSEQVGFFSAPPQPPPGPSVNHGDYSQNVRIIEGHDDLELDRGAGYMSLTMRKQFLQTQMVQLPPLGADSDHDPNASSAHLYDSLEREEEEELYPAHHHHQHHHHHHQDLQPEHDRAGLYGRHDSDTEDLADLRSADHMDQVHFVQDDLAATGGGYIHLAHPHHHPHYHQQQPRVDQDVSHFLDDGEMSGAAPGLTSPGHHHHHHHYQQHQHQHAAHDREQESEEAALLRSDNPGLVTNHAHVNDQPQAAGSSSVSSSSSTLVVVSLPKQTGIQSGDGAQRDRGELPQHQPLSARPKQGVPSKQRQPRGGPAGSNGREGQGASASGNNRTQAGVGGRPADRRGAPNSRASSRVTVGAPGRQQASGAHSQRPAVQGAAVTVAGISGGGDGDGAVAAANSSSAVANNPPTSSTALAQPNPNASLNPPGAAATMMTGGATLLSRTSSQGSLHSTTSSTISNSRVSGVGKESNSTAGAGYTNQHPRPNTRPYTSIPGSQDPQASAAVSAAATAAGTRAAPSTTQQSRRGGGGGRGGGGRGGGPPNNSRPPPQRPPPPHRQNQAKSQPPPPTSSSTSTTSASTSGDGPQSTHPPKPDPSPPGSKQKGGATTTTITTMSASGGGGLMNTRTTTQRQLQQQQQQLQQEQQRLLHKQQQLQQHQQHQHHHQHQHHQQHPLNVSAGMESLDGDHLVHHHQHSEAVVTQVSQLMQQERQERSGVRATSEVQGMEEVRSALQSMLRLPRDLQPFDQRSFDFAESASDLLMDRPPAHYQQDVDASSVSGLHRGQGVMEEMGGDMYDSFPSFSFKMFSSDLSSAFSSNNNADRSLHAESAYLRESLEKERYRRKHCEQQIQSLNAKLLEIQQQLAVAVSTDKRKDIMIDQLDKQLAKVVEGWKKREAEKDEYMSLMMKEKSQIEDTLQKQQHMVDSFEKELASTVEELKQEKENSASVLDSMKEQLSSAVQKQRHAEEVLAAEKERVNLMEKDWEQLKESRDLAEKRAQQAQDRLHQEQDSWYQREQELVHKIDQVKEANLKVMQMERVKLEEQTKKAEDLEEQLHTASTEVKRLEMELDSAHREKESVKVEMALKEAKAESAQRALQAEMQGALEKEVSEQVSAVQQRLRQEQEEQAERHRQTVQDLHQRHQRDLEHQMSSLRQDMARREEDLKAQLAEADTRMNNYRQEITALKQAKQKLESQRLEVLNKLQIIMQSQWNEAVSLLVTTPQRKTLNTSLSSSLGGGGGGLLAGGGGVGGQLSATTGGGGAPHYNISTSTSQPPAASGVPPSDRPAGHSQQHRRSGESSPRNNLSGSQSPRSSPSTPPHPRPANNNSNSTTTTTTTTTRSQKDAGFSLMGGGGGMPSQMSAFGESGGVTLQDLTAMLSDKEFLPLSIHGVTHHAGLVASPQPALSQPHYQQQHSTGFSMGRQAAEAAAPPESQAFMIRPPQQSSRAGLSVEDLSFVSDVSSSSALSSLLMQGARGRDRDRQRELSGDSQHSSRHLHHQHQQQQHQQQQQQQSRALQHPFSTAGGGGGGANDRGLELHDLDVSSRAGLREGMLMAGGSSLHGSRETVNSMGLPSVSAYPPSMSPPVKQGREEQDSTDGSVLLESDRLNSSYREISRQLEEHQSRQRELQHYIKMLLDKPPGTGSDRPERDSFDPDQMDISFGAVAAELGLTEAAQAAQLNSELLRLQQLRDRQATSDQTAQSLRTRSGRGGGGGGGRKPDNNRHPPPPPPQSSSSSQSRPGAATAAQFQPGPDGVLSPEQLAEISRLLGQYSEDVEASYGAVPSHTQPNPLSMAQIIKFLACLPQSQQAAGGGEGEGISSTKSSPRQQPTRRARDPQRCKKQDPRHHSVGPETSLSSTSVTSERSEKNMASSTRSSTTTTTSTSRSKAGAERKVAHHNPTATAAASSATPAASTTSKASGPRSHSKDQHPVWK